MENSDRDSESIIDNPKFKQDIDIGVLHQAFKESVDNINKFQNRAQENHNTMICYWEGQSSDQRKWAAREGERVFPYAGSSDIRIPFVENYVRCHVAKFMEAFRRMRIIAYPISSDIKDISKSHYASAFLKFIISQMKEFYDEAELAANYYFRYGLTITYQCWDEVEQRIRETFTVDDIPAEFGPIILDEAQEALAIEIVSQLVDGVSVKSIKKALAEMRADGSAELVRTISTRKRAMIKAMSPIDEVFFPASATTDINKCPVIWHMVYKTPEEVVLAETLEGWNGEFVDKALKQIGVDSLESAGTSEMKSQESGNSVSTSTRCEGLIQLLYSWERKIDSDGVSGVYLTISHPMISDVYAKRELSSYEHGQYPFTVTKRERWSNRLYDTRGYPEIGYGFQANYKGLMDSAFNAESLTTMKPMQRRLMGLQDSGDVEISPLAVVDVISHDQYKPLEISSEPTLNIKMREDLSRLADDYFGRVNALNDPAEARAKTQLESDKLVQHFTRALDQIYLLYKQYGDSEMFFKVSGREEAVVYKNDKNDIYDFQISIDNGQGDIEIMQTKVKILSELGKLATDGSFDMNELAAVGAEMIDAGIADRIIKGPQVAYEKSVSDEQLAIAKITSGVGVDVPEEQFNQVRYDTYMQWFMKETTQKRLAGDQEVAMLAENRAKQWEQQKVQYTENAQTGRMGAPQMGAIRD